MFSANLIKAAAESKNQQPNGCLWQRNQEIEKTDCSKNEEITNNSLDSAYLRDQNLFLKVHLFETIYKTFLYGYLF
jgi:hypothetical protein